MRQPIVLPKFTLPGDRAHWAVRTLWIAGGLVVVQAGFLGLAVLRHQSAATVASSQAATLVERVAVKPPVASAAAVAPAPSVASTSAIAQETPAQPAALAAAVGAPESGPRAGHSARKAASHRLRHSARSGKLLAAAGASQSRAGKVVAKKSTKPDAIDDLLRKFK